jgi:hypothetical protein
MISGMYGPRQTVLLLALLITATACSKKPPPDYAPDPGLVSQIREIRILPRVAAVCPGRTIQVDYHAVLADGRVIAFARKYDDDDPPPLHVIFLRRTSPEAVSQEDGDWNTAPAALVSAMHGFRLSVELRADPALSASAVVPPEYSCLRHAYRFDGRAGARGEPGFPGPDVLVRLGELSSPFYERLLVVAIEVGDAPPFYLLQDPLAVSPSDWLRIDSRGGRGGRGEKGAGGARGRQGAAGCPGTQGGPGGRGGPGGPGGPGGSGGHVTVMVPGELPYLAGVVEARSPGGQGGSGGPGGDGGRGGEGGEGVTVSGRRCAGGPTGEPGPRGETGPEGASGQPGPRARVITVSAADVFGRPVPPGLQALLDYARRQD